MFQVGISRDVGIVDCYRYYNGAPYKGAFPIIVEFKQRREKEQILWRSKDRLKKLDIVVTDDTTSRTMERQQEEVHEDKKGGSKKTTHSPKKKAKAPLSPEKALFEEFFQHESRCRNQEKN